MDEFVKCKDLRTAVMTVLKHNATLCLMSQFNLKFGFIFTIVYLIV